MLKQGKHNVWNLIAKYLFNLLGLKSNLDISKGDDPQKALNNEYKCNMYSLFFVDCLNCILVLPLGLGLSQLKSPSIDPTIISFNSEDNVRWALAETLTNRLITPRIINFLQPP